MTEQTFVLPDVGEGLTEAEIVQWRVAPGDSVAVNDVIVEIETAKSLVELPSPYSGTVGELLASEGSTVEVGAPIITIGSADAGTPAPAEPVSVPEPSDPGGAVLVGYGTGGAVSSRRRTLRQAQGPSAERPVKASVGVVAKPPIRKLARDLGVDLSAVTPSGPAGEVTRDDVVKHAEQASVFRNIETPAWGAVREETIRSRLLRRPPPRHPPPSPTPARSRSPSAACARRPPTR